MIGSCQFLRWFSYSFLVLLLSSCSQELAPSSNESSTKITNSAEANLDKETYNRTESFDNQQLLDQPDLEDEAIEYSHIYFCGYRLLNQDEQFKLYDSDLEKSTWVKKGQKFGSFEVVKLSDNNRSLILELGEYWYEFPYVSLQFYSFDSEREEIVTNIPEGVNAMEYISRYAKPLNPAGMPELGKSINENANMDEIEGMKSLNRNSFEE